MKKASIGLNFIIVLILIALGVGAYFLFFASPCSGDEIYNPYEDICVEKRQFCVFNSDCSLLEGQTASFPGGDFIFTLLEANELSYGDARALINIQGIGETEVYSGEIYTFGDYEFMIESADGDKNLIMGAEFALQKVE